MLAKWTARKYKYIFTTWCKVYKHKGGDSEQSNAGAAKSAAMRIQSITPCRHLRFAERLVNLSERMSSLIARSQRGARWRNSDSAKSAQDGHGGVAGKPEIWGSIAEVDRLVVASPPAGSYLESQNCCAIRIKLQSPHQSGHHVSAKLEQDKTLHEIARC